MKIFFPLILVYVVLVLFFAPNELIWDEHRYMGNAENILKGQFIEEDLDIRNGPGYPLFLAPFTRVGLPLMGLRLLNVGLMIGFLFFSYSTLRIYVNERAAIIATYLLGLYPEALRWVVMLYSETLSIFLVSGFMYFLVVFIREKEFKVKSGLLAAFFFAFLALTKLIFAQVLTTCLIAGVIGSVLGRKSFYKRSLLVATTAYVLCVPYLIYTFSYTGKFPLWGTNGGEQLYWMTSPYEGEMGDWMSWTEVLQKEVPELHPSHYEFYTSVESLNGIERNDAFVQKGIENFKEHPQEYLYNWIANMGRFLFHYPYSFRNQTLNTYVILVPNMVLIFSILLAAVGIFKGYRDVPTEFWLLLFWALVYFGGSSLVHAETRYFWMVVPTCILWVSWTFSKKFRVALLPVEGVREEKEGLVSIVESP
ncbi:MAG: glycosyltransferase family 39 protein [Bacteroidota bacterium]